LLICDIYITIKIIIFILLKIMDFYIDTTTDNLKIVKVDRTDKTDIDKPDAITKVDKTDTDKTDKTDKTTELTYSPNLPISEIQFLSLIGWLEKGIEDKYALCEYSNIKITDFLELSRFEWFQNLVKIKTNKLSNEVKTLIYESITKERDLSTAKWYAERKMKSEFWTRSEMTVDWKDLLPTSINIIINNHLPKDPELKYIETE